MPKPQGRRIKDFWPRVLGWAAGWAMVNGRPDTQAALERVIADRIAELGREAEDTQVSTYARELLQGIDEHLGR